MKSRAAATPESPRHAKRSISTSDRTSAIRLRRISPAPAILAFHHNVMLRHYRRPFSRRRNVSGALAESTLELMSLRGRCDSPLVNNALTLKISFQMFTTNAKIIKSSGAEPDQFEASISNALLELEMNSDLKSHLRELHITKAKEIETNNKKVNLIPRTTVSFCLIPSPRTVLNCPRSLQSIIIYVPMPKLKAFQKIQTRLVRELEKKFSGKHVMFVGERKILPKPTRKTRTKNKQKRPRR